MKTTIRLNGEDIRSGVNAVSQACDTESTRYALACIQGEFIDGELTLIATDGRRLHKYTFAKCQLHTQHAENGEFKIPEKVWKLLAKASKRGIVQIEIDKDSVTAHVPTGAKGDKMESVTDKHEGRYPGWRQIWPNSSYSVRLSGTVAEFKAWIESVRVNITPEFAWDSDGIPSVNYIMTMPKGGRSYLPKLKVETKVPERITFNTDYLSQFIDGWNDKALVELMVMGDDKYIATVGNATCLFMGYR